MHGGFDSGHGVSEGTESGKKDNWFKRVFKPRDILIRSQGRVTFINLSPKLQMALCLGVSAAALWGTSSTITSLWQNSIIDDRNQAIIEAKLSQNRLKADFQAYKVELERITNLLQDMEKGNGLALAEKKAISETDETSSEMTLSEEIIAFRVLGDKVNESLARASLDFEVKGDDLDRIVKSRSGYQDEIIALKEQLENQRALNRKLSGKVSAANQALVKSQNEYEALENNKKVMGHQIKNLTAALSESREEGVDANIRIKKFEVEVASLEERRDQLDTTNEKLSDDLELLREEEARLLGLNNQAEERIAILNERFDSLMVESGLRNKLADALTPRTDLSNVPLDERLTVLEETSSDLMDGLVDFRDMSDKVEQTLDGVVTGLSRVTGYTREVDAMRENRPQQAMTLLSELESIHDDQITIVSGLLDRTEKSIAHKQETLSGTGLDLNKALAMAGLHTGTGGPEIIQEFTGGSSSELNTTVATLEQKVQKLQALDKLISCVPLVSPVDYYHVTSKYGMRKDPFTGKNAMHKGIDMGGWPGTTIHATAGGKVVKAYNSSSYGKMVEIDHGCGITTIYGHLKKILVKKGDEISHRDPIGKLGSTGRSTGPHVHYEIRLDGEHLDPMKFIEAGRHVYKG
ncbi:peptidoglycan DD-metalloendopeptidase family protein [Curvivirga sp.]|uniref:peptidoglycan DD-metalloendopeptidase family protein n=1 Tax=Curvivirga sp. TaxID=2856848 RepID=UPI003B5C5E8A